MKGSNIFFSIGIPAYKGKYLEECISSVLSQDYRNFELIIVNDKSPDNIYEIVSKFTDNRIKYFENELNIGNVSVVKNWNNCLNKAQYEFFVLLGDDDVLEPNYLSEFINLIKKYPGLDVYQCRCKIINENSKTIDLTPLCNGYETVFDFVYHRIRDLRIQFISNFVFRTKRIKETNGFYDLPLAWISDDISVYNSIGNKGIAYTSKSLFKYRSSNISISNSGNYKLKIKAIKSTNSWLNNEFNDFIPRSNDQEFLRNKIKNYWKIYQKKKIIEVLSSSISLNFLSTSVHILKNLKKYDISFIEFLFIQFVNIKSKIKSKYY